MERAHAVTATFDVGQTYPLTVALHGSGGGVVTSNPAGIDCGTTCQAQFASGTQVTLTAAPDATSLFDGWGGACSGTGGCAVAMSQAQSVAARFIPKVYRPDALVRTEHTAFVGGGVYGSAGGGETITAKAPAGSRIVFVFRVENGGNVADAYRIHGPGARGGLVARYLAGASGRAGITTSVVSGRYETNAVDPGGGRVIRLVVTVGRQVRPGTTGSWLVVMRSAGNEAMIDAAMARVVVVRG
jgi:hypothetical protein